MNQKVIIGIGVLLLMIILLQTVFLIRMSGKVDQLSESSETVAQSTGQSSADPVFSPAGSLYSPQKDSWNPFEEMQRMQNEMNKIFGDMRSQLHQSPNFSSLAEPFSFSPNVDVKEESNQFIITADIPGSDESNINVTVNNQTLTISATTKKTNQAKNKSNLFRSERFVGQFQRSITLPAPVLAEKIKTDYKDGVLTITLPKA